MTCNKMYKRERQKEKNETGGAYVSINQMKWHISQLNLTTLQFMSIIYHLKNETLSRCELFTGMTNTSELLMQDLSSD